jgi:hypothetical protein
MKQVLDTARQRIDPTQIRPLVKVATMACKREIIHVVCAAVLSGNYMLDVMQEFAVVLVEPTILATLVGPLSDQPPGSGINHY